MIQAFTTVITARTVVWWKKEEKNIFFFPSLDFDCLGFLNKTKTKNKTAKTNKTLMYTLKPDTNIFTAKHIIISH